MNETLNIAQVCPETRALGPGKRFVIWVQGCPFNCKGCVAPDWIPLRAASIVPVGRLVEQVAAAGGIEGVTISGGEPMLQAGALCCLLDGVRRIRPELTSIAFTGFTLERLRKIALTDRGVAGLLQRLDVLIDGLYVEALNDGRGLRGSSNQSAHFLTDRYGDFKTEFESGSRRTEMHLLAGELLMVGVPTPETLGTFHAIAGSGKKIPAL